MALDSTVGGSASDSYVASVDEAIELAGSLASMAALGVETAAFIAASEEAQTQALVMGADGIDQANLDGLRQTTGQARAFPRINLERAQYNGVVPAAVKLAQVADACALMTPKSDAQASAEAGVSEYDIGEERTVYNRSAASLLGGRSYSQAAEEILRRAGLLGGRISSVYVPRG